MDFICDHNQCSGCTACRNVCLRNAISMVEGEAGFKYPQVNHNSCINCGLCKVVCPVNSKKEDSGKTPLAYAAYNNDEKIRMESSSGGLFTLISSKIIEAGGVVFGAAFNDELFVVHDKAETVEELEKFRSSKYMQSDLGRVYREVKIELDKGRKVLFTGTPCQVEGLVSYLKKDYDNLYLQDLICHGVPSKNVWKKYLEYKSKENGEKVKKVSFRNKENKGWNNYELKLTYDNKEEFSDHSTDWYMRVFLNDIALRESCYHCNFKKRGRISDITLADFWGINKVMPEMNDEKGTSLIMVNSEKGKELFNSVIDNITYKEVDFDLAISNNGSMLTSPPRNPEREAFLAELEEGKDIEYLVKKYIFKEDK